MRRAAAVVVSLLLAFGFAIGASRAGQRADLVWQNVTLYLEQTLSVEDAQTLARTDSDTAFVAWTQKNDRTVMLQSLGNSVQTHVVFWYGSPELLLSVSLPEEEKSCVIGTKTAWDLSGSTDGQGQALAVEDRVYTIGYTVSDPDTGVYVMATPQTRFDRLTIAGRTASDGAQFLLQHGLKGHVIRMDDLRSLRTWEELVPGKWSDFSGWKQNWQTRQKQLRQIREMKKTEREYVYEKQCRIYWRDTVLMVFCVIAAVGNAKPRRCGSGACSIRKKVINRLMKLMRFHAF